jgi:hypothetical protein
MNPIHKEYNPNSNSCLDCTVSCQDVSWGSPSEGTTRTYFKEGDFGE